MVRIGVQPLLLGMPLSRKASICARDLSIMASILATDACERAHWKKMTVAVKPFSVPPAPRHCSRIAPSDWAVATTVA